MAERWANAQDIIKKASGGSLLRGTLHNVEIADKNEYTITRRHLLNVPTDVIIRGPFMPKKTGETTFTSINDLKEFEQAIENTETHFGAGLGLQAFGCSVGAGVQRSKTKTNEYSKREDHKNIFVSNVKYAVVPVASCQFNKQTLTFSREAYDSIKEFCFWTWHNPHDDPLDKVNIGKKGDQILKYVWARKEKYNACANFFENFGSHVYVGVIHLGGILTWKSVFSGETTSSSGSIKDLVAKSLQAHVKANIGLAVGGGVEISASKHKRKLRKQAQFKEDDISKTILSCTVYGGSAAATSIEDWQKSLPEDYASWNIVNRGDQSFNDHFGVWDILKNDTQFYDLYKNYTDNPISDDLKRASSSQPETRRKDAGNALSDYFSTWIYRKNIKYILWKAEKNPTSDAYLKALLQIKSENQKREKICPGTDVWDQFLQEDDCFQNSVLKLPNLMGITLVEFNKIWKNIKELLKVLDVPADNYATSHFPKKVEIKEKLANSAG